MPPITIINQNEYALVKIQRGGKTGIYKYNDTFLRIGDKKIIRRDVAFHEKLLSYQFPVAKILEKGVFGECEYYIESSLGNQEFSKLFANDIAKYNSIQEENFSKFLDLTQSFALAQLNTMPQLATTESFAQSIHVQTLCEELPQYAQQIVTKYNEVMERLSVFPWVMSQGDYNAHNIFPKGVIDFTDSCIAPFGYDLLGAIVHNDYFPTSREYEYFAEYQFSADQKARYYALIDKLFVDANLPKPSFFISDFEFCKAIWLLVGIHKWPKLQHYRYNLFIKRFLQ